MDTKKARELLAKQQQGTLTPEEQATLASWYLRLAEREGDVPQADLAKKEAAIYNRVSQTINGGKTIRLWPRIAAAASIILAVSVGSYFILHKKVLSRQTAQNQKQDIAPGSDKAILTLASGQKIILTSAKNGQIAKQGQTLIQKTADGRVVYQAGTRDNSAIAYNTMTTPRGGQHWVTLADGSKVLLNAASSLTYPVAFNGKERKVILTGEAYFEVMHNDKMPFRVVTKGEIVEDIGTHFNINAYEDEPITRTTLLEGGIKIRSASQTDILKPGQQAVLKADQLRVSETDIEDAIAWKNGRFIFDSENIQSIMRKLSRWYDLDIAYKGEAPVQTFSGDISRFENISQVLELLDKTNSVHFSITGRRVTVMK
jgi:transmembrane sensor